MSETNGHCQDGQLSVQVVGGPHDGKTLTIDLLLLRLTAQLLYDKHGMESDGETMHATAAFVKDLSDGMESLGYSCTPAIALHAWQAMGRYLTEVEKKTKESPDSATSMDSTSED